MAISRPLVLLFCFALVGWASASSSADQEAARDTCSALVGADVLSDVRIVSAELVPAGVDGPAHCAVSGVIETEIKFEVLLPDAWNGRFMMGGGGGFVGTVQNQALNSARAGGMNGHALERGYATAGTDTGHQGTGIEGAWALNDPERQQNYGYRAVHLTVVAAKAIIREYYDQDSDYSYFLGCSNGGRQAMMESQRYPDDFDGIVAGAPAFNWTGTAAGFVRNQQAIFPDGDLAAPVLTPAALSLVSAAIDDSCDLLDGVDDGILADPRECGFNADSLPQCIAGSRQADCLTAAQLTAIKTIWEGPVLDGRRLFAGFPFGGEDEPGWAGWVVESEQNRARGVPNAQYAFGTEIAKYFVFSDPLWDYTRYDLAMWPDDTAQAGAVLNATDTDLTAYRDAGGKIIYWTGWSDPALSALGLISYYETLREEDSTVQEYARLFALPGVLHCGDGPGPDRVDWIDAISSWVEEDDAPDRLVSAKVDEGNAVAITRPVCPYPMVATYTGSGSTAAEENFVCEVPD